MLDDKILGMNIFKKRETITQNISYMAIMAAINVVFVLLTTFVPYLFFLIVFVLPLTSTIVMLFCKKRYFAIYAFSTLGICLIITLSNIGDTLFYVLPSIITGGVFGLLIEKKVSNSIIIIITSIIQSVITYATLPLIELFSGVNVITTFVNLFKLENFAYIDYLIPISVFFISLMQTIISFMVVKDEIEKISEKTNDTLSFKSEVIINLIIYVLIIIIIIFAFIYGPISYLLLAFLIYLAINETALGFMKMNKILTIILLSSLIVSFFLFSGLYSFIPAPFSLLLIGVFFIIPSTISFIYSLLKNFKQK